MYQRAVNYRQALLACLTPLMLAAAAIAAADQAQFGGAAVAVIRDDARSTRLQVTVNNLEMEQTEINGRSVKRLTVDLEPRTALPGWPELPMVSRVVYIPPTAGIRLQINNITERVRYDISPFITPPQDGSAEIDRSGDPSDEWLTYDGFWPPEPVVLSEPAILRGHRLVQVTLFPVRVNPATGAAIVVEDIDFELVYEGEGINPVRDPLRPRPSSSVQRVLESLVVNPPRRDEGTAHPARGSYLLIYPNVNGIVDAIAPLIDWRARQGWRVTTAQVQNGSATGPVQQIIREAYNGDDPPEMVVLVGDADGSVAIGAFNQTDLDYVLLEGNDILADADIGRISVESVQQLRTVVNKLVSYEADPYMDDTDWYHQGMVCAGAAVSGLSTILVNRWVRRELLDAGFDNVHEWYFNAPFGGMSVPQFFQSEFERGIAFSNYRGWVGIEGTSPNQIMNFRASRRWPTVVLLTCSSGNYIGTFGHTEAFLRSPGGGNGAVGLNTNNTHVQFNNAISVGIWVGFLKKEMWNFGTAVNYGRYELWRQYNGFLDNDVQNFSRWTNLMGDPATHIFTDIPARIDVTHDEFLSLGGSKVIVRVNRDEGEEGVAGATVCLYKEDDAFQMVKESAADGSAEFFIASDALSEGDLLVTVTKHNTVPYLGEIPVRGAVYFFGATDWVVDDDQTGDSRGDEDGTVNPGEAIELRLVMTNTGEDAPQGAVIIRAATASPFARVSDVEFELEQVPDPGESVEVVFLVEVSPTAPDGEIILVDIAAESGEFVWPSAAVLEVIAPKIQINEFIYDGGALEPGQIRNLDVTVENIGRKAISAFRAHLFSTNDVVNFPDAAANFPALEPEQTATVEGELFRIRAHPFTIPGMSVPVYMVVADEGGFTDTSAAFDVQVGRARAGDPFGPDKYGYVCFDSEDEDWEIKPTYDWIEIDPEEDDFDFRGTLLNLRDNGEDADQSAVVELPFDFTYYGRDFNQLTICTNGWAAFGNWRELTDFRNRRIASGGGPNAQLAVFWDNLTTGRILTHHDADGGRFIVEWNDMRRQWSGDRETFQLILYDTRLHPTYSGDGIIDYQYKSVRNGNGQDLGNNDTPYATIGIGNLDDTDGLEYTYWNRFSPGATPLQNELAIRFTTATVYITGAIAGTVTDAATGEPIPGAQVTTTRGFWAETDDQGHYIIDDILIGEGYEMLVSAQGYNDSLWAGEDGNGLTIAEDETLHVNFALLHPEFNINRAGFSFQMNAFDTLEAGFDLTNDGNGTLWFTSRYVYVLDQEEPVNPGGREGPVRRAGRDEPDEQWDLLLNWAAGDTVDDTKLQGVEFVNNYWIVAGGASGLNEENWFYRFDRWGHYVDRLPQPIEESRYGIRDLDYHGGFLYGVLPEQNQIMRINPETGELLAVWQTPRGVSTISNLAIDPDGYFWVSSVTSNLFKLELQGDTVLTQVESFRTLDPRQEGVRVRAYGLAWFRDDPDGYNVYMMANNPPLDNPDGELGDISLFKLNPQTGEIRFLTNLPQLGAGNSGRGGICITAKWNNLVWAFGAVIDNSDGDAVAVIELAPNSSWIDYTPRSDTLFAGDSQPIEILINTADLDTGEYGVVIEFTHNARGGVTRVPVDLRITTLAAPEGAPAPLVWSLSQNYPNPFNPFTTLKFTLPRSGLVELKVYDLAGREVRTLVDGIMPAGAHQVRLDATGLPGGVYFYRLRGEDFTQTRKMALVK